MHAVTSSSIAAQVDEPRAIVEGEPPRLRLQFFGMMRATNAAGDSVLPRARKTRALLAVLGLAMPRTVLRTRLTGLLWSQREPEQARASLRQALHALQEALGPIASPLLWADRHHIALRSEQAWPGLVWTDVHELQRASTLSLEPLERLTGDLLDDLNGIDPAFDRWLGDERIRLRGLGRERAEAVLGSLYEPDAIVATAERLLAIDPGHEAVWRAMICAHIERGDRGAALAAFERCRAALGGLAPPADITERIAALRSPSGLAERIPRAPAVIAPPAAAVAATRGDVGIRLGVMPMRSLDGQGEDSLSMGLAEEITTALSRFRWMSCIASPSVSALAGEPYGSSLWEQLDLDFILEGTVQRSGGRIRVTSRLLDMRENRAVIWARRFDREMTDILALQDDIAAETVAQVDPELLLRAGERAAGNSSARTDPTAYELLLRAIPAVYRLEQNGFMAAGDMLRTAVALDPGHAAAHAWLAYWNLFLVGQGWAQDPLGATAEAGMLADRAVTLDPGDARGLTLSGHVRAFLGKRAEEGMALHQRAVALNPNLPMAWAFLGLAQTYVGRHQEAIASIGQAHRLSPFDPHCFFFDMALTMPHLLMHDHEAVVRIGRRAIELNPGFSSSYKGMLAALGHLGRTADAADLRARLLQMEPRLTLQDAIDRSPMLRPEDKAHYAEGLRLAGL